MEDALGSYIPALLEARYPRHPRFTDPLTKQRVERLVERFGEIVDAEDKRIAADKGLEGEMRGTLGELGLVRVSEGAVHLLEDQRLQDIENTRRRRAVDQPTVGEVRRWIDETGQMGLQSEALDLLVRCYTRWSARTLVQFDKPYTAVAGKPIPDEVVLEKPDLPGHADWAKALELFGKLFGETWAGRALHADNLKRFQTKLAARLQTASGPTVKLPRVLSARCGEFVGAEDVDRMTTARSGDDLCAALAGKPPVEQVRLLAAFEPRTSPTALAASLVSAVENVRILEDNLVFGVFTQLAAQRDSLTGGAEVLEQVASALRQDEVHVGLAARLRRCAEDGQKLLQGPERKHDGVKVLCTERVDVRGARAAREKLDAMVESLKAKLESGSAEVRLVGQLEVTDKDE